MIRNYLKIALRSLVKQKVYSAINILGLSVGIASCVLIMMFVVDEFSFDRFHAKADRIYKLTLERKYPTHSTNYAVVPHSYADVLATEFPEVADVVKMGGPFNDILVSYQTSKDDVKQFEEDFVMAADSNFFQMFSVPLIEGDPKKVLLKQSDIVVSRDAATRYFGNTEAMGKTLRIFNQDFTVAGVSENIPENSHFKFDFLLKWDENFFGGGRQVNFTSFSAHVYLELKPGTDPSALEQKFPKMVDTYAAAQIERDLGKSWADYKKEGNGYRYFLQPLTGIHLDPTNIEAKMKPGGNINYIYFLIAISVLILAIACINFMNLATARSAERAKEVGVRKTLGSMTGQLIRQFLVESILLSVFSTVVAVGIIYSALPYFNSLSDKHLTFTWSSPIGISLIFVSVGVGFLAGSYPAFVLSAFNPVVVMKGSFSTSGRGSWLRNGLVVFQFFISIILIVGTIVVSKQMIFMQNKSLGYDKDRTLVVERAFGLGPRDSYKTFVNEILKLSGVEKAGAGFSMLGRQRDFFGAQWQAQGSSEILTTKSMAIDDDFAATVNFEFAAGRGYSKETNDSLSVILNESAVRVLGIDDPVGKKLSQVLRQPGQNVTVEYTIIGVIKDFNFQSLRDAITPLTIQSRESFGGAPNYIYIKLKNDDARNVIAAVEKKWKEMVPQQPFKYEFLDDNWSAQYESEKRAGEIFGIFSALAIIIACVGLFGLAAYTASLRTKEIGIRKVLGASVPGVVFLLSKDFTKLILMAFVLAAPVGWFVMNRWLQTFAYRIDLDATIFLLAGLLALVIAWLTVSYQSIKAAIVNPVRSLRSE